MCYVVIYEKGLCKRDEERYGDLWRYGNKMNGVLDYGRWEREQSSLSV